MKLASSYKYARQTGLSLVELMVSLAIATTVMSGVVQVLVVSKSNFVTEREMAALQENARFTVKFLTDTIRMAGFTGCVSRPLRFANSINSSSGNWYLDGVGLQGFEYDAGVNTFPSEFRADVAPDTDAIVVRRGERMGLRIDGNHNPNSAQIPLSAQHSYKPGQVMVVSTPDCQQVGIFQMSGPANNSNNAQNMVHNTGASISPGNCTKDLAGNFDCSTVGNSVAASYPPGSSLMEMRSEAFYIGASTMDSNIPALFRERLLLNSSAGSLYTAAEELVQGVENLQILYGLDGSGNDGIADRYVAANNAAMNWDNVVSVRLGIRMRSIYPVYNRDEDFDEFLGVEDTDGSDRYMRQVLTTTITLRN